MLRRIARAALFAALVPLASFAQCGVHEDFLVRSDSTLAPVRPADCATVEQAPPEFTWPPVNGKNLGYTLTLKFPDGRSESRTTHRNWLLWDAPIPPGAYAWTLKVSGSERDTSEPRSFTIARDAVAFVVPSPERMLQRALATPR